MPNYEISITNLDEKDEATIARRYGNEFFKLSNEEVGENILDMFNQLNNKQSLF